MCISQKKRVTYWQPRSQVLDKNMRIALLSFLFLFFSFFFFERLGTRLN